MNPDTKETLLRILREARIDQADHWLGEEERYGTPILEKALFMREAWRPIIREGTTEWIDQTITSLESRIGRKDLYALRFLPEQPDLLAALQHIKGSDVELSAITHIVRQSQLSLLSWIISILDGGHCFEDGLSSNWSLCANDEDGEPSKSFGDMKDYIWEFDPDRRDC